MSMLKRVFCKKHLILGGFIPTIYIDQKKFEEYQKVRGANLQNGWERVKIIFKVDSMGSYHPDLQRSLDVAETAFCVGALLGGVIGSKEAVERFRDSNDATLFHGNRDALSQMGRKSLLGTALGALKVAPVFAAFAGGFILFTSCVQAYRLEEGFLEYCVGGFMVGSLFRFHYGIKGMLIGGVVASLLGGIYGVAEIGFSKLLGKDTTEMKFLLASYKMEVADSISTYNESDVSPSFTISERDQNSSHSKTENKTKCLISN